MVLVPHRFWIAWRSPCREICEESRVINVLIPHDALFYLALLPVIAPIGNDKPQPCAG